MDIKLVHFSNGLLWIIYKKDSKQNMRKDNILKIIERTPGISYNEIVRESNLSNGVVSHYILSLMEGGNIEKYGEGRPKYFHSKIPAKYRNIISVLRNDTNLSIVKLLLKSESALTSKEICKEIDKSASTVSVSLKNLQNSSIVERKILNRNKKLASDIGYTPKQRMFLRDFLVKYKI